MSATHTPRLLRLEEGKPYPSFTEIKGLHFRVQVVMSAMDTTFENCMQRQDDLRRLVACWNSCDGVQTELLEEIPGIAGATVPYRVLRMQHADLLAKLQMAVDRIEDMLKDDDGQAWDEAGKFVVIAQAAITKAGSLS